MHLSAESLLPTFVCCFLFVGGGWGGGFPKFPVYDVYTMLEYFSSNYYVTSIPKLFKVIQL